ncbi:MAG: TonB-dependent receptor [Deltaproteobacteria bacterium]|nr:TonB-dependent receptor [Deltaproteobacteria bacterium]
MSRSHAFRSRGLAAALALALAGVAQAQLSTATIKGQISAGTASAPAGMAVVAVNKDSGFTYKTTTKAGGGYVLAGLPPGEYEIRITGPDGTAKTEAISLAVGETASVDLAYTPARVEEFVVTGTRRKAVKTSEVGTSVTQKQIQTLPQATSNFLAIADLAPGVVFSQDQSTGFTKVQAGAQNNDNVNVFIDGVSQKNQILRGGVTGQDSSRGNPFPQSAIAQFKVITSNYKAEYDQVSSAAITAVTKSGTNELHGGVSIDRTETDWRNKSPLEREKERSGQVLLPSSKNEWSANVNGAIKEDVVHYAVSYDGKNINDSRQVVPRNLNLLPGGAGIVPSLAAKGGTYVDPFNGHLIFGKLDAQLAEDRKLSGSALIRLESDHVAEDRNLSAHGNDKERSNNAFNVDLFHEWNLGNAWLSESRVGYTNAVWNPKAASATPFLKYKASPTNLLSNSSDVIFDGGSPDNQKRGQSGIGLSQNFTFSGLVDHVFKGGAKANFMKYDLSGTSRAVDIVEAVVDNVTGLPYYDGASCTGTNITNGGNNSDQCKIDRALAPASVGINNTQIGLFVQDDWTITKRLEANIGVRWDVETNMLNNGYVTPADRVAALYAADGVRWGITPPAGQTYAQSLARGGVNLDDYVANGSKRKAYLGAFAPRLGASFDVLGDKNTVVFAGWGRSYDRTMANHALDEKQKNLQPNGEIWLIRNDFKMPYADQMSLGVRQAVLAWNVEVSVSQVDAKNQFQWFSGNRDANGGWATQPAFDPLWGGPNGYGSLILGDFIGQNRTRSLMMMVEKPYSKASPWEVRLSYTLSDAKTKHREWDNDIFDWSYGRTDRPWNPSRLVDRHRFKASAFAEIPWGLTAGASYNYGSGLARRIVGCFAGCQVYEGTSPSFKQLDVSLMKAFKAGPGDFIIKGDLFNVFNTTNYLLPSNPWGGGAPGGNSIGGDALDADKPDGMRGPMRTLKVSAAYRF